MRALVQRVSEASVTVDGGEVSRIGQGLLVLLGVRRGDTDAEADKLAAKLLALRIFEDADGKMNLNVEQAGRKPVTAGPLRPSATTETRNAGGAYGTRRFS